MPHFRKMKRALASLVLVSLCYIILGVSAVSAPIGGSWQAYVEVEADLWSKTRTFRAGERAAVLAIGDHKEAGVKLHVSVLDAKGVLIAEDKGESELAGDYVGLVWYPPRDGDYRIEVRQSGGGANKIYVAIK